MKLQRQYTNDCLLIACLIWNNPLLIAGGITLAKGIWQHQNITWTGQVIKDRDIIPFHQLKMQFGLNDSTFLQHLQLRSIFKKITSKGIILGSKSVLDGKLRDATAG